MMELIALWFIILIIVSILSNKKKRQNRYSLENDKFNATKGENGFSAAKQSKDIENIDMDRVINTIDEKIVKPVSNEASLPGVGGMADQRVYTTKSGKFKKISDFDSLKDAGEKYKNANYAVVVNDKMVANPISGDEIFNKDFFENVGNDDLRKAVVMKEILDMPLSLR